MNKTEQLKELRARTQAGMKDCNEALLEANGDVEKAVDIIKTKGKNIVSGREGKVASEGIVVTQEFASAGPGYPNQAVAMVEVNCQTDFVALSPEFNNFAQIVLNNLIWSVEYSRVFDVKDEVIESFRTQLVAFTKENIVVRRWWVEEVSSSNAKVVSYVHTGGKIGVVLSAMTDSATASSTNEFSQLIQDLAMQVAAMNPLALSRDRVAPNEIERQRSIFETQLKELNKPAQTWNKIIEGKFNKWYSEVCLLEQESIVVPKSTVQQVIQNVEKTLGSKITLINMIRCQVGEGIEKSEDKLADEVAKLL